MTVATIQELDGIDKPEEVARVVIERIIQGAARMKLWPAGMLNAHREWCDLAGTLLINDEVMTGFGREKLFACEHEQVQPIPPFFCKQVHSWILTCNYYLGFA
ncbi:MAG: aminotransferase class III-fold pyridoxal phosphate-dependent enzyme [Chthoniobacterales bacterium]|nr:aminotransferase class III-fold pyridoxal phosphate-dependent enzyme [Chthoniobacterales bacterium]